MQTPHKILLTGATGFLGSNLLKALVDDGCKVIVLKRPSSDCSRIAGCLDRISCYDIGETCLDTVFDRHPDISCILHAATCYGTTMEQGSEVMAANFNFPMRLLTVAVERGIGIFINTSTPLDKYLNYYSMTKRQFEEWGRFFAEQNKIRFINVVLEYMFGENDNAGKFSEMIFDKLINNEAVIPLTAGTQRRDFIYIKDVVNAYRTIINNLDRIKQNYCDIGVGSGKAVEVKEFIEMAKRMTGAETRLDFGVIPYRVHEQMYSQADTSVLQSFGWRAEYPLEQAIRNCIQGKRK